MIRKHHIDLLLNAGAIAVAQLGLLSEVVCHHGVFPVIRHCGVDGVSHRSIVASRERGDGFIVKAKKNDELSLRISSRGFPNRRHHIDVIELRASL